MRYAIFTDIHANLEALEAVLAKIDEISQKDPIDQIWFLGDLVGYGPNPNECIDKLRERTDIIIAGNHDWAAVGKIDLEDFSEAARISAQWTAEQLTEEHRTFLMNLPERLEMGECLLVHGSPYGPLWEYLTSEVLAERSFQHFSNRFCFVGHTHVPVIFIQQDTVANAPTVPLQLGDEVGGENEEAVEHTSDPSEEDPFNEETVELVNDTDSVEAPTDEPEATQRLVTETSNDMESDSEAVAQNQHQDNHQEQKEATDETQKIVALRSTLQTTMAATQEEGAHSESTALQNVVTETADKVAEIQQQIADDVPIVATEAHEEDDPPVAEEPDEPVTIDQEDQSENDEETSTSKPQEVENITPQETIANAEERLNEEIEELLALLGLSQSMISVTNEMLIPPEGGWQAPEGYRAIVNPGGVGQPRDGDARAAFMIYDNDNDSFTFYRISYDFEKTQEKIIKAKLPQYLATRLAYGR